MSTVVVNKKTLPFRNPGHLVYIGRPSKWGNPFILGIHGNRETVVDKYREWIATQTDLLAQLPELKGKTLVCFCKPLACHGDVLVELVNGLADNS